MNVEIFINCDGDIIEPEIQISGSWSSLSKFGAFLEQLNSTSSVNLPVFKNEFYPQAIKRLAVNFETSGNGLLTVGIDGQVLNVAGNAVAIKKLACSLINFFDEDTEVEEHFQLDYYEGNDLLNETSCTLIFLCDRL
ncbi:hypothetical protein CWC22_022410 [Pseudoalteromonas rubra]|uniref:Uncharacterized protein n=1 Tax=Pseudoalteromonas rubra TaxID=43658 RepID=A0A5S3UXB5_9GAMM|nr:hypothetical protein [Pseudoalteromonas rubra]QPB85761.1 hypothetical protein CWC22_022410 [Pseudoalteromonas rubra]